jgi:predicted ester cyclase
LNTALVPGQKAGIDGLIDAFKMMRAGYPDIKFTVKDIIIEGNKAAVLFNFSGTNTGEMMGMKPTGKPVNIDGIDYLVFKDGKAIEHWGYVDVEKMMQQLGLMQGMEPQK